MECCKESTTHKNTLSHKCFEPLVGRADFQHAVIHDPSFRVVETIGVVGETVLLNSTALHSVAAIRVRQPPLDPCYIVSSCACPPCSIAGRQERGSHMAGKSYVHVEAATATGSLALGHHMATQNYTIHYTLCTINFTQ